MNERNPHQGPMRNSIHGSMGSVKGVPGHHQNFFIENSSNVQANLPQSTSPTPIELGTERLFSQNNHGGKQGPINPRKIIVKRSRHIKDLS